MDLMPTSDQEAIQAAVRSFVEHELPMARVREIASRGAEAYAPLWRGAGELGFFGLGLPESAGGAGYALTEEMVLMEELGRALAPGAWLGSVLAAHALADAGAGELAALRGRILAGELPVALAEGAAADALRIHEGHLTGRVPRVPDAAMAGAFLVLVGETGAFLVPQREGVAVMPRPSMDLTRQVAELELTNARAIAVGAAAGGAAALRRQATVLACAEAVGGIQRTVEASVEYGKVRTQFDKPIGSFQAVKHRCADMATRAEMARAATIYATVAVRDGAADADFQVSVAKILCANAFLQNAADNVQNHGGMGFTWECDAHLFVKRARSFDLTLGSRARQLDALVERFRAA